MAGALDELFPSMMSDSSTFFDDNFGELAAAAAATVDGSTFESAFSFRRRSSAPSLAMPFSPEETPRPCLHQRTPPLLQARRLAARATGISGFYSVKTNAMGSGAGSSSVEARGARELLFKMGDEVHVRGDPYAPFVDTDSWCSGTRKHQGHLPGLCSARGVVAGHEQRGVEQRESPRWRCRWGPSEARCAPLVRLLLLFDLNSWCSGTRKHRVNLPGLCSARGGVAGHEQRGVEPRESPREWLRWGPSEARCAPLVRLFLIFDLNSWCSGTRKHRVHLPGLCSARGVVAGHEQRGVEQHESPRGC